MKFVRGSARFFCSAFAANMGEISVCVCVRVGATCKHLSFIKILCTRRIATHRSRASLVESRARVHNYDAKLYILCSTRGLFFSVCTTFDKLNIRITGATSTESLAVEKNIAKVIIISSRSSDVEDDDSSISHQHRHTFIHILIHR